ncbi:lycopene cyclase domain-containing protein [Luteipulveratus mongoliensis]|uniref:lycopene cyclase domain-containing protein n=1 Tax=Luteipulveratus mongoliensis TaxID=571913 RepID=UPI00069814ED|nr:lycopene cyclase domain-containing protein [Luteipulveratus mongoliensis]
MTYTLLAAIAVPVAVAVDLWVLRTQLVRSRAWWLAYAVIVVFQLLTNGWLTGRRIVQYDPGRIVGDSTPVLLGHGRIVYAPVEDLGFGFALVLLSCAVWVRLGRSRGAGDATPSPQPAGDASEGRPRGRRTR